MTTAQEAQMSLARLIWFLLIGLVAGWIASMLMKDGRHGVLGYIVIGVIGALLGGGLFGVLGLFAGGGLVGCRIAHPRRRRRDHPHRSPAADPARLTTLTHRTGGGGGRCASTSASPTPRRSTCRRMGASARPRWPCRARRSDRCRRAAARARR